MPLKVLYRTIYSIFVLVGITSHALGQTSSSAQYKYFRIGSPNDVATAAKPGFALMGGGTDLDEAFRWMCLRAGGGDFLVLRATGDDDYNPYIQPLCKLNSVATLILPNREAANDSFVAEKIAHAEAIFIAGGDQANYIRYWKDTPVPAGIDAAIRRGVPVGGTSAGLAVLGEWAYSAEGDKPDDPNLDAKTALMNPMGPRVTLVRGFLDIAILKGLITDSHFVKRNRLGRLLVFLARIQAERSTSDICGLGVNEKTAVLVEPNGEAHVVGAGPVYVVQPIPQTPQLRKDAPLSGVEFYVQKIPASESFNLMKRTSNRVPSPLWVRNGELVTKERVASY